MQQFQKVMYANSDAELKKAIEVIHANNKKYPCFVERFDKFLHRQYEWVTFHRLHLITRNNNTNNFCEATMRIIKDIILCRTKAFNIVALAEFFITIWNQYLIKKLLEHAHNRVSKHALLYDALCSKMANLQPSSIKQLDEISYSLPSSTDKYVFYVVNTLVGNCTCASGKIVAFCKHQGFLRQHLKINLPNAPILTCKDRHNLAFLALGENCRPPSFFLGFTEMNSSLEGNEVTDVSEINHSLSSTPAIEIMNPVVRSAFDETPAIATDEDKRNFLNQLQRLSNFDISQVKLIKLTKILSSLKTTNKINEAVTLINMSLSSRMRRKGGKIKVQPTALSRRQTNITKGSRRIPAGRPLKSDTKKKCKRQRNLSFNVKASKPNAKSHGTSH